MRWEAREQGGVCGGGILGSDTQHADRLSRTPSSESVPSSAGPTCDLRCQYQQMGAKGRRDHGLAWRVGDTELEKL